MRKELENEPGADALAQFIPQGAIYLLREKKNICQLELTFRDAVDPALLQAALDAVLARAPYFRMRLVWDGETPRLLPGGAPCRVAAGDRPREIPEETDGYLFDLACLGPVLRCRYFHFLADGRGIMQFLAQLALDYCRLRYGLELEGRALASAPALPPDEFAALYRESRVANDLKKEVVRLREGEIRRTVLHTVKADWIAAAQRYGVKPVCCMMGVFCKAMRRYTPSDTVRFSYAADARGAMGVPDALYNCVAVAQGQAELKPDSPLERYVRAIDAQVRAGLREENLRALLAQETGWGYEVLGMKAPLRIKRRVFRMGEYASGFYTDFWFSYLGDALAGGPAGLYPYITDYQAWVSPDDGSAGIEAVSLNGTVTFCIQDKLEQPDFGRVLQQILQQESIRLSG